MVVGLLLGMLCTPLCAAENDAAGCKDHPLIPRMAGYIIAGCSDAPVNTEVTVAMGEQTETVHMEGNSTAVLYMPQPELASKPSEAMLKSDFENAVKLQGGRLIGETVGQNWPFYHIAKEGREFWGVLMVDSGQYFTGSYGYRIVEK